MITRFLLEYDSFFRLLAIALAAYMTWRDFKPDKPGEYEYYFKD